MRSPTGNSNPLITHGLRLSQALGCFQNEKTNVVQLVFDYNSTLEAVLNEFAPEMTEVIPFCKRQPWYTPQLRCARQHLRRLELKWKRSQSKTDLLLFKDQRVAYNNLLDGTKGQYYASKIDGCKSDPKKLFQEINS